LFYTIYFFVDEYTKKQLYDFLFTNTETNSQQTPKQSHIIFA